MAEWENGMCSHVCGGDCLTCLGAWFCSCFLHGRAAERLKTFPSTETPELCNFDCLIFWLANDAGGCGWIPMMMKRREMRHKFGIKGHQAKDCAVSFWCQPCGLAQMETEVKRRAEAEEKKEKAKAQGYSQPHEGMQYQPPQDNVPPAQAPNDHPPAEQTPPLYRAASQ